jgi:hypothetical protein
VAGKGRLFVEGSVPAGLSGVVRFENCSPCAEGQLPGVRVSLTGKVGLEKVWAKLDFVEEPGVELLSEKSTEASLIPGKPVDLWLGLRTGEDFKKTALELSLELRDEGGRLARWVFALPMDGSSVSLSPPIVVMPEPLLAAVGSFSLAVKATDDRVLDHLVVFAGTETVDRSRAEASVVYTGDKLAWMPGGSSKGKLTVQVPVVAGINRYTVLAEDDQGLVSTEVRYVLGE